MPMPYGDFDDLSSRERVLLLPRNILIVWYMRKNNRDFIPCFPLQMDYEDTFLAEWSLESLFADIDNYSSLDLVRAWSNEVHFLLLYHGLYLIFIVLDVV
ncbi:hypothetical protein RHGRI_023339 [Rhododendron griersonianum]|uniref:Uncharacterized protein n=1 Tax=Rhododendron griersonianum TaxID=479676 RepID=A0AAV6J585_9ERIC|nr:hypothetical protein RHGRI_023339 [Rhododendron griersonianum]KAG5535537.1 hypothetical protein RHGRI_023339 [Rhododendron griersonianum]